MELTTYVEGIRQQLAAAAETGGEAARALAERLAAPLDAAIRLALQDALGAAAEEITRELAPGSVELRIRGRNPEFVVTLPPPDPPDEGFADSSYATVAGVPSPSGDAEEGGVSRINLRMPDHLKARVEQAAGGEGLSVNTWLVRAASFALDRAQPDRGSRAGRGASRYTGWVR